MAIISIEQSATYLNLFELLTRLEGSSMSTLPALSWQCARLFNPKI